MNSLLYHITQFYIYTRRANGICNIIYCRNANDKLYHRRHKMKNALFFILFTTLIAVSCSQVTTAPPVKSTPPATTATSSSAQNNSITPFIVAFEASPDNVKAGTAVTLTWEVTNATLVSIDQGIGTVAAKGTRVITPKSTATYILTATNNNGSSTTKIQVTVSGTVAESTPASFNLPEVVVFTATPANIVAEQTSTLTWDVRNAYDVVIDPGFRIIRVKGIAEVMPSFSTIYKLTATNDQGTILAVTQVTVSGVPPSEETPVIKFLKADRYVIKRGETAVLSWKTTEASSVTIDKGVGTVAGEGTARVTPSETTIYSMIATNPRGAQFQSVAVNVK